MRVRGLLKERRVGGSRESRDETRDADDGNSGNAAIRARQEHAERKVGKLTPPLGWEIGVDRSVFRKEPSPRDGIPFARRPRQRRNRIRLAAADRSGCA